MTKQTDLEKFWKELGWEYRPNHKCGPMFVRGFIGGEQRMMTPDDAQLIYDKFQELKQSKTIVLNRIKAPDLSEKD